MIGLVFLFGCGNSNPKYNAVCRGDAYHPTAVGTVSMTDETYYKNDSYGHVIPSKMDSCNSKPVLQTINLPQYNEIERRARIKGYIKLKVVIDSTGKVKSTKIISSTAELFNKSLMEAAAKFIFSPYKENCIPKECVDIITVTYSLVPIVK